VYVGFVEKCQGTFEHGLFVKNIWAFLSVILESSINKSPIYIHKSDIYTQKSRKIQKSPNIFQKLPYI